MDNAKMFSQVIDYQKTLFDNSFAFITELQAQGEQMMTMAIEKNPLLPDDSIKVCSYWTDFFRKSRENYKIYADTNFTRFKDMFETLDPAPKKGKKAAEKKA